MKYNKDIAVSGKRLNKNQYQMQVAVPMAKDVSSFINSGWGGTNTTYVYNAPKDAKAAMITARQFFYKDPLARRIIELMSQLAVTNIRLRGPKKNKPFFKNWMYHTNIETTVAKYIAMEYFLSANAYVLRQSSIFKEASLKKLVKGDFKLNNHKLDVSSMLTYPEKDLKNTLLAVANAKKNKMDVLDEYAQAARKFTWSKNSIPTSYAILNPEAVTVGGVPELNMNRYFYTPPYALFELAEKAKEGGDLARFLPVIRTLPLYVISQIEALRGNTSKQSKGVNKTLKIELLSDDLYHIARMKRSSDTVAYPLMMSAFEALDRKGKLIAMDRKIIDHMIKKILLIKVGNDQFPAKPRHIKALNNMMTQQGNVWKLVWNHAIDVSWVEVDVDALINGNKYQPVNTEIRSCFGLSSLLTGEGTQGTEGAGMISMRGLIENITDCQQETKEWLQSEYEYIGEKLQLDSVPEPVFNRFHLEDKVSLGKIYTSFVDRGIFTNELVAELHGEDWEGDIIPQLKREKKLRDDEILPGMGSPYQVGGAGKDGKSVTPGGGTEGKPTSSITDYPADRKKTTKTTKNKVAASQVDLSNQEVGDQILETVEAKDLKKLAGKSLSILEKRFKKEKVGEPLDEACHVLGSLPTHIIKTYDLKTMAPVTFRDLAGKKLESSVATVTSQRMAKWRKENPDKSPNKKQKAEIVSSAWAICRVNTGE